MKSFLERWAEGETESPGRDRTGEEPPVTRMQVETAESRESRPKSLNEWKAAELNKLFGEQGLTGKPGRLTAETVGHGSNRGTGHKPRTAGCDAQVLFPGDDPNTTHARSDVAGLLAIAFQRYAKVQRGAEDHRKDPAHGDLALPAEPSVHGVVP